MFSVVTPVFNQSTFTYQYLSDMHNSIPEGNEVIVVDNGSTDNTKDVLDKWASLMRPNLIVIHNEKNLGFSVASNQGYAASRGDKVIFLNNDIKTKHSFWHKRLLENIKDNNIISPSGGYVDEKTFAFKYETQSSYDKINYLSGWCLAGKRDTFEKMKKDLGQETGPFIEEFVTYFEDTYMGFQCKRLGIEMKVISPADIVHFGKMTSRTMNISEMYLTAKAKFTKKILEERGQNG